MRDPLGAMDLNDVHTFVASAEAHTLTEAARELRVPASTVSRAITRLEKRLNVTLVQRGPRGFTLTDVGRGYLASCKRALRALNEGEDRIEGQRAQPSGLLKVACPITFARDILAPLLKEFLVRFPGLTVDIDTYTSGCDYNPADEIDVLFKVMRPRDSSRRIRSYPGHALGLFASNGYVQQRGLPKKPDDLIDHTCIGRGSWKLVRDKKQEVPQLNFIVGTHDPHMHLTLVTSGLGIGVLPLWLALRPDIREQLTPVLPQWKLTPLVMCALYFGPLVQTPKVQALLDFCGEYIGTPKDPRLHDNWSKDLFPTVRGPSS